MLNVCITLYEASDYYMRVHISDIISNGEFISYCYITNSLKTSWL